MARKRRLIRAAAVGAPANPQRWSNQDLLLYHGTLDIHVPAILRAVAMGPSRQRTDFGKGFYTTTVLRQARAWAWAKSQQIGHNPAVVCFELRRDDLAALDTLCFVRGSFDAEDFWSIVFHCRAGRAPHRRAGVSPAYDVVVGPIAASRRQRTTIFDADQVSFHTKRAITLLNNCRKRTIP